MLEKVVKLYRHFDISNKKVEAFYSKEEILLSSILTWIGIGLFWYYKLGYIDLSSTSDFFLYVISGLSFSLMLPLFYWRGIKSYKQEDSEQRAVNAPKLEHWGPLGVAVTIGVGAIFFLWHDDLLVSLLLFVEI